MYKAIGTNRRLAAEIVDDMKLGKLVKLGGFRSGVATAENHIRLRWNEGLGEVIRGVTKNLFAASGYVAASAMNGKMLMAMIARRLPTTRRTVF